MAASPDSPLYFNAACDQIAIRYVIQAWQKLGWKPRPGAALDPIALERDLGIAPRHHRLFQRCLRHLTTGKVLRRSGKGYAVSSKIPKTPKKKTGAALFNKTPECLAELALLRRCGLRLAEILRGEADPVAVLFQ